MLTILHPIALVPYDNNGESHNNYMIDASPKNTY